MMPALPAGSTYPVDKMKAKHSLALDDGAEGNELMATVEDDTRLGRNLATAEDVILSSSIVGLSVAW